MNPCSSRPRVGRSPGRVGLIVGLLGVVVSASTTGSAVAADDFRIRPVQAIPSRGPLPPMVDPDLAREMAGLSAQARTGSMVRRMRRTAGRYFGPTRGPRLNEAGLAWIASLSEPIELFSLPMSCRRVPADVRDAILDHLADTGGPGLAALASTAIDHPDSAWRRAAAHRLSSAEDPLVLAVIQNGLRSGRDEQVRAAAGLAGLLDARLAIPHLIATQYAGQKRRRTGDQAWIAIGTQTSYIQNLVPVVGDGAGAFRPVPGIINQGFVMRVTEAIAVIYRTEVHRVLVDMTTRATGRDTSVNGWSLERWREWYNAEYLPLALVEQRAELDRRRAAGYAEAERRRAAAEEASTGSPREEGDE